MPTRLKKPSITKQLAFSVVLIGFQAYLGYSAVNGQFGTQSQKAMQVDIEQLKARSASLQVEIDAYRHRVALFRPEKLDPDIVTERARALLNMANPDDIIVMTNPATGLPISGLSEVLPENRLSGNIEAGID